MGWIEKLGQEVEAREKQKSEREAAKKTLHKQKRDQAAALYQESGVGVLVQKLTEVLKEDKRLVSYDNLFSLEDHRSGVTPSELPVDTMDIDSMFNKLVFDWNQEVNVTYPLERITRGVYPFTETSSERRKTKNYVYRKKVILVETRPDGNIVFHGAGQTAVSKSQWEKNREALEVAFKAAFDNPCITEWRHSSPAEL